MTIKNSVPAVLIVVSYIGITACSSGSDGNSMEAQSCNSAGVSSIDENITGDISSVPATPTSWSLGAGANILISNTSSTDTDYVTFTVGTCDTLDTITVNDFTSVAGDNIAFIALQNGSEFTVTPETANSSRAELLGYRHYGTADIGQDILAEVGQGQDAIGFISPLPAGTYSMWLNQTGSESQSTLIFNVSRVEP